jgi:hypothetical protein
MGCGALIPNSEEAAPRNYRIVRTGLVYSQFRCEACHSKYLSEKPGIAVSDRPPAPSKTSEGVSTLLGEKGIVVQRNGRKIVLPKCATARQIAQAFGSDDHKSTLGLGVLARAKQLRQGGRP